ncbi:MAG: hypothetical protein JNK15_09520 [Planctomycetes bacterium]|nr:hypothetical protein [Planctomycetota bacterium]
MPKNKDLKRLVRARMQKTGESFTTARQHLVAKKRPKAPPTAPTPEVAAPADYEVLAGVKDATVQQKTGCTWRKWVEALDYAGAAALTHAQIARLVQTKWRQTGWWAQTITVGYERIRGRRAVHERTGGFAVTKSRTFAASVEALSAAFTPANRRQWLGDDAVQPRKSIAGKVARWKRSDGSTVEVNFVAKGPGKACAQLQHAGLAAKADVERWRAFWTERFAALAAVLARN